MTNKYYKHKYGGIYKFITKAINTDDKGEMVVYEHVYPFDESVYVRKKTEFDESFEPITEQEYIIAISTDKHLLQKIIFENKTNKRHY